MAGMSRVWCGALREGTSIRGHSDSRHEALQQKYKTGDTMWDWVINNVIAVALLIAFLITHCYALRLRSKMSSTSKPRFAFVTSATLASCLFALLSFLSGAGPMWIGNKILSGARIAIGDGRIPASPGQVGWFIGLMSLIGTVVALVLIYRFSV